VHHGAALQFQSQAFIHEGGARLRVRQVGLDAHAIGRDDPAVDEAALAAQHAGLPERGHVVRAEAGSRARGQQRIEQACVDAVARAIRGQRALQRQVVVDAAAQDARAVQVQHLVDEHLGGAEQPRGKGRAATHLVDERCTRLGRDFGQCTPPGLVLLVAQ